MCAEAIIPESDWEAVQQQLAANWYDKSVRVRAKDPSLLAGLVFDDKGRRLIPHHANRRAKRNRYCVMQSLLEQSKDDVRDGLRIPAHELESAVINGLIRFLSDDGALLGELAPSDTEQSSSLLQRARQIVLELRPEADAQEKGARIAALREIVHRVMVAKGEARMEVKMGPLLADSNQPESSDRVLTTLTLPIALTRCGMAMRLIVDAPGHEARQPDATLITLLRKAQDWLSRLRSGSSDSIKIIAQAENVTSSYVTRVIYLAFLAPDIVKTIMAGKQPPTLSVQRLIQLVPLPLHWPEQRHCSTTR